MSIETIISTVDGVTVVGLVGDLDLATAPEARRQILRAVHQCADPPLLVLDLLGLDLLDAVGIGVLLAGVVVCRSRGGEVALCRAEPQVLALLHLTRIDEILPVHPDVGAAVTALGPNLP